jgi:Flp pilus assembly secretin CpaC
MLNLRDVS